MDLGVSSPQLDDAQRGFSFKADGLLDMRMNQNHLETAADIVNNYDISDLAHIFKLYGEERFARRVAKFIVQYREEKKLIILCLFSFGSPRCASPPQTGCIKRSNSIASIIHIIHLIY